MPKNIQPLLCCLVFSSLVFVASGCRTTSSKLASVPGLGWLERDDEGWAGYEPAPSLPRPSSVSEPTLNEEKGVSNIASDTSTPKKTKFPSNPFARSSGNSVAAASTSPEQPDVDGRSLPQGSSSTSDLRANAASSYGDYASAYGKYGPPKSLNDSAGDSVKPQQGPYDAAEVPKYARSSASTTGYDAAFGASTGTNDSEFAATERTSRFEATTPSSYSTGADGSGSERVAAADSTYHPPGFITKPKPSNLATTGNNRFAAGTAEADRFYNPTEQRTPEYVAAAPRGLASTESSPNEPQGRYSETGTNASSFLESRFGQGGAPSSTAQTAPGSNPFATSTNRSNPFASNPSETLADSPRARLENLGREAAATLSQSAHSAADQVSSSAQAFGADVSRVSRDSAAGALEVADQTASGYLDAVRSKAAETQQAAGDYLRTAEQAGANLLQNVGNSAASFPYPTTSTPHGYLDATTPTNGQATPTTSSPSTIRRSSTPFRPGSTSTFQSSMHTVNKQEISLATSNRVPDNQLVLAVGDKFQFPRTLR